MLRIRWFLLGPLALGASFGSIAPPALAAPRWVDISPTGRPIQAITRAGAVPPVVYVADFVGTVFRSADDGASWQAVGTPGVPIAELLVAPADLGAPETVVARSSDLALVLSRDGGRTWLPAAPDLPGVLAITLDARRPGALYAATELGLYRSDDRGAHFAPVAFADANVLAIAVDPRDGDRLFAVFPRQSLDQPREVAKSTDRGVTWTQAPLVDDPTGLVDEEPHVVFDAARPNTIYLFFDRFGHLEPGPLFRSTDGGASWQRPTEATVRDLISTPGGRLYATFRRGVVTSDDRGGTWQPLGPGIGAPADEILRLAGPDGGSNTLLAAGRQGVWRSSDGGAHWRAAYRGLPPTAATDASSPPIGPRVVLALAGGRTFSSDDRGARWRRIRTELAGLQPSKLTFDGQVEGRIWGLGGDGQVTRIVRSDDLGRTWRPSSTPVDCGGGSLCQVTIRALALDPSDAETLYAAGRTTFHAQEPEAFLIRTRDGGRTWRSLPPPQGGLSALAVDPHRADTLLGLTPRRFAKSDDGGRTWRFAGRGRTWRFAGRGLPRRGLRALAIDPADPGRLFVGTGRGVFTSLDGGETFAADNRGIEQAAIDTIVIDPSDPRRRYAAAGRRGVFRYLDAEHLWRPLSDGLPLPRPVGALSLDPREPTTLYAALPEGGIFRLDLAAEDSSIDLSTERQP